MKLFPKYVIRYLFILTCYMYGILFIKIICFRSLDFDETTEPKQLRSTGSLKEVTYAELEMDFNPPDITSDMYDNTMDDLDYMTFCARTTLGVEYPNEDIPGMAIPVVEFSREGYKIRKVFG